MSFDFQLEKMSIPKDREMLGMMVSHIFEMIEEGVSCIPEQCFFCPFSSKYRGTYRHEDFIKSESSSCLFSIKSRKKVAIENNLRLFLDKLSKYDQRVFTETIEDDKRRTRKRNRA